MHFTKSLYLFLLLYIPSVAQNRLDTTSLAYALKRGSDVEFLMRWYSMTTYNQGRLTDYYAHAFGGGLKYTTGSYKGFRFAVGGFFAWNLGSSDLTQPDSYTGVINRYEIGQFDMQDPKNKTDMDRLETFHLQYEKKGFSVTLGKQSLQTPFLNPQDGRMRPTSEDGLVLEYKQQNKWSGMAAWIHAISPRGTVRWFDLDQSIGIYPSGMASSGTKSNYAGNLNTSGLALLGIRYNVKPKWSVQFWDYYVPKIFHTAMLQSDIIWKISEKLNGIAGIQFVRQHAVGDGGNQDRSKTFFDPSQRSGIISTRMGVASGKDKWLLNYTRITEEGRFLFPREWGREPFYTFIKRERNEGAGDVNAFVFNNIHEWTPSLKTELAFGYYDMPAVTHVALNKYSMPSYHQFLLDANYAFSGFFKNLSGELLYTYKKVAVGSLSEKVLINKANMHHFNLILNYHL